MRLANATYLVSLMRIWNTASSFDAFVRAPAHPTNCWSRQSIPFVSASTSLVAANTHSHTASSLAATKEGDDQKTIINPELSSTSFLWNARQDCWRPDVRDVEKISYGMPAKKKKTGSRGVPHRLNEDERRSFDQARRQGFLQVTGSSWRSQRRDAPLLNTYRSLMDARGRPAIVLYKLSPNSSGGVDNGDRLVVDLSPLRFPDEFESVERGLRERISTEFGVESQMSESAEEDSTSEMDDDIEILGNDRNEDDWETRPIYQISPYVLSWEVSRHQGKQVGKFLGLLFDNVEEKATKSKKPKGVRPGKGRRHGGYGIG